MVAGGRGARGGVQEGRVWKWGEGEVSGRGCLGVVREEDGGRRGGGWMEGGGVVRDVVVCVV